MTTRFYPRTVYADAPNFKSVELVLAGFKWGISLGSEKRIYVSGPITTGPVYEACIKSGSTDSSARERAKVLNIQALDMTTSVMKWSGGSYLNPGMVEVEGWTSEDYLLFFTSVITSGYVKEVRLLDGWERSNGCVAEVICALTHHVPVMVISTQEHIYNTCLGLYLAPVRDDLMSSRHAELIERGRKLDTLMQLHANLINTRGGK